MIIPPPAWARRAAMVGLSRATPVLVPRPDSTCCLLDPADLRKAVTPRSRGIILNSPSNPTGAVYGASHLAEIAKIALDAELWVLSDDVYEHIVYDGLPAHILSVEPRLKSRGIVFNSLSKTYAMTGWRIGFAAGPKEAIAAAVRLQGQNSGNPNSITQAAAIEAVAERVGLSPLVCNFLAVVARNRRLFAVPAMIEAYLKTLAERRGEVTAEVIAAQPLSEAQQAQQAVPTPALRKAARTLEPAANQARAGQRDDAALTVHGADDLELLAPHHVGKRVFHRDAGKKDQRRQSVEGFRDGLCEDVLQ